MWSKALFVVSALFLRTITGQCIGSPYNGIINNGLVSDNLVMGNPGLPFAAPVAGLPHGTIIAEKPLTYAPSIVETFPISCTSHIPPGSLTVFSDNLVIEGPIVVTGQLPFLASVALQGQLPAIGQGAVSYGCGNGDIGITTEGLPAPVMPAFGYGNGFGFPSDFAYGPGFPGIGHNVRGCVV